MHPIKYPCFLNRIEMILHSCFKKTTYLTTVFQSSSLIFVCHEAQARSEGAINRPSFLEKPCFVTSSCFVITMH